MKRLGILVVALLWAGPVSAETLSVGPGEAFEDIASALAAAAAGDVVLVQPGTYEGALQSRPGVILRGVGEVIATTAGLVLDVDDDDFTLENIIIDAQMAMTRAVRVRGNGFTIRDSEVRNARGNCVDLREVDDVLIEGSEIHHCLRASAEGCSEASCREDAHGVVGGAVVGLRLLDTVIHTFSGDALQLDSDWRNATRAWDDVHIEGCTFWMSDLAEASGGFAAGVNPSENAIDTKTNDRFGDSHMTIVDTVAYGFRGGLISNASAFNLKQNVVFNVDRVTVYDSEIAFRLRGSGGDISRGIRATISNALVVDCDTAYRYEDGLSAVRLVASTIGQGVGEAFDDQSRDGPATIEAQNVLVVAADAPAELDGASNRAVEASEFVDAASGDYHLVPGAGSIDAGDDVFVATDRDGVARPQGAAHDLGAFEWCEECIATDAGPRRDGGPGSDGGPGFDAGGAEDAGATPDGAASDAGGAEEASGCSCRLSGRGEGPSWLLAMALVALVHRRRR